VYIVPWLAEDGDNSVLGDRWSTRAWVTQEAVANSQTFVLDRDLNRYYRNSLGLVFGNKMRELLLEYGRLTNYNWPLMDTLILGADKDASREDDKVGAFASMAGLRAPLGRGHGYLEAAVGLWPQLDRVDWAMILMSTHLVGWLECTWFSDLRRAGMTRYRLMNLVYACDESMNFEVDAEALTLTLDNYRKLLLCLDEPVILQADIRNEQLFKINGTTRTGIDIAGLAVLSAVPRGKIGKEISGILVASTLYDMETGILIEHVSAQRYRKLGVFQIAYRDQVAESEFPRQTNRLVLT
jgi:hypothetical protein